MSISVPTVNELSAFAVLTAVIVGADVVGSYYQPKTWGMTETVGGGIDYSTPLLGGHLAVRLFQADYQYNTESFAPGVSGRFKIARLSSGLVYRIGGFTPPPPVTLACVASPTSIFPGEPVTVTATAGKQGADLRIIGTQYQRSPYCLTSLAKKPIRTPQDMIGHKIGLAASDEPVWAAFLKLSKISASQVPTVPIQFDPSVLVAGECEAIVAFSYEQSSELAQQGVKTYSFLWDDYGFKIMWNSYIATAESVANAAKRQALVDFLYGEALGWTAQVKNPKEGATLAVEKYGASLKLNLQEQTREAVGAKALIVTAATQDHGLFAMPASGISNAVSLLHVLDLAMPKATFDTSLLADMHKQHPSLAKLVI